MSASRPPELQAFIEATHAAILARSSTLPAVEPLAAKIFAALRESDAEPTGRAAQRQPVCLHLSAALDIARTGHPAVAALANALAAVEPRLAWSPKAGSEDWADDFANRHANAVFVGEGGIEHSDEARIGVSLVAPNTHYPRHRHAPEELYVVLSQGAWMNSDRPMQQKATGDLVHNNPHDWHAMQAGDAPLLAVWCLWHGTT